MLNVGIVVTNGTMVLKRRCMALRLNYSVLLMVIDTPKTSFIDIYSAWDVKSYAPCVAHSYSRDYGLSPSQSMDKHILNQRRYRTIANEGFLGSSGCRWDDDSV